MSIPDYPFTLCDVQILKHESLYKGFFKAEKITLRHRLYAGGWSSAVSREVFVRGAAVGVVLYDPKQDLIGLVEQIRIGALANLESESGDASPWCMEVVAGMVDTGETLEDVAWREVKEETSIVPSAMEYICEYMASPGGCTESLHLFCAQADLSQQGGIHGLDEEDEDIKLHVLAASDVFQNLYGGRFNNAATMIGLQWLQLNHKRLCLIDTLAVT